MVNTTAKESSVESTTKNTKEGGWKAKCMERECLSGRMGESTLESIRWIESMEMGRFMGWKDRAILGSLLMDYSMGLGFLVRMVSIEKEGGRMGKELNGWNEKFKKILFYNIYFVSSKILLFVIK